MTLRVAAALALLLGAAALLAYLHELGKGPWADPAARHLRAVKDRAASPAAVEPLAFAELEGLPRRRRLAEYAPLETRGVVVEGYVVRILHAPDGDLHLDLAPEPVGRAGPFPRYAITELTPQWRRGSRNWSHDRLAATLRPTFGGATSWEHGPRRVRLSGWLLYDYPHEGWVPSGFLPLRPVSAWEVHPVTRIELWDDSLQGFVEYPR